MSAGAMRRSSLGCLGVLSAVLLLAFTAGEVTLVAWLDPGWLDRVAFWRPAPFEPEPLPVEDPAERAALQSGWLREMQSSQEPSTPQPTEPELFPFLQVRQSYDPARGARLQTPWNTTVDFPAGAVDSACDITLTPVRALPARMALEMAGPAVDLRVGAHEHYDFRLPIRMTLPLDPEVGGDPRIAVWEQDHWAPLPTTVDRQAGTLTAEVPHASVIVAGAKLAMLGGAGFYALYQKVPAKWLSTMNIASSLVTAATYAGAETFETQAFRFYYYTSGADAVPADSAYPVRSGQTPGGAPLYVKDLAAWFEEARLGLKTLGLPIRPWTMRKHDVFISAQGEYGSSPLGGPLFISSRNIDYASRDGVDPESLLRHAVAHELFHVAQDRFYSRGSAATYRWWIECSAAYLGDTYWQLKGGSSPNLVRDVFARKISGTLLATPLDEAVDPDYYAWASLLTWLDRRYGAAGFKVFADLTSNGSASLPELGEALQKHTRKTLPETFAEFAGEYHYGDLWDGELSPATHRGQRLAWAANQHMPPVGRNNDFINVVQQLTGRTIETAYKPIVVKNSPHMTASVFYMRADRLPESRRARLVVKMTMLGGLDPGLWIYTAADRAGSSLPVSGAPNGLEEQVFDTYKKTWVFDEFNTEKGTDLVTLLVVNTAASRTAPGFEVERWLLEPPQNVDFRRKSETEPNIWVVTWDEVGLATEPPFKGCQVYRRLSGEPEESAVLITEWPEKTKRMFEDSPKGPGSYVYTVTVVDHAGNESKHSRIQVNDPFEGRWDGRIHLVEGSLVDILGPLIDHYMGGEGSADLQAMRQRLQAVAQGFDLVAKLGIPVELELSKYASGRYFMRVTRAFGKEIADAEPVKLLKKGDETLLTDMSTAPDGQPPLVLRLSAPNEMKDREITFPVIVNGESKDFTLRWNLEREVSE